MSDPPGLRPMVMVVLAVGSIRRHRLRAALLVSMVAVAAGSVVATSGRTDATRHALLARLEDPRARLITITMPPGELASSDVVNRFAILSDVAWVVGVSQPGPVGRNPALGDARRGNGGGSVGTLRYWGPLLEGVLGQLHGGRMPGLGEAVTGSGARTSLALADGVGTVADEGSRFGVVGTATFEAPIERLNAYVLVHARPNPRAVYEVLVLARTSSAVERLARLAPTLLGPTNSPPSVERATELLDLQAELAGEIGSLDAAVLIASLGSSILVVATLVFAASQNRRREFGLRRSQGATRSVIGGLVLMETAALALVGAIVGALLGDALIWLQLGVGADVPLMIATTSLVFLATCLGAAPLAIAAAFQEPLYVLRAD